MITAESVIAKAVVAVVGKLAGSLTGMAVSRRRKACRYLVKLYYAMQALEETTARTLHAVDKETVGGTASKLIRALATEQVAIEHASNAFIDLAQDLQRGLSMLDPALNQMCQVIYRSKGDFLSCMSFGLAPQFIDGKPKVELWLPNERLLSTDFEQAYGESTAAVAAGTRFYWPDGVFDYFTDCEEVEVTPGSDEAAERVMAYVREHHGTISAAKERLRELLKASFTVEELLFHADETPR